MPLGEIQLARKWHARGTHGTHLHGGHDAVVTGEVARRWPARLKERGPKAPWLASVVRVGVYECRDVSRLLDSVD